MQSQWLISNGFLFLSNINSIKMVWLDIDFGRTKRWLKLLSYKTWIYIPTSVKNKFVYTGFERLEIFSTFKWNWTGVPVLNSIKIKSCTSHPIYIWHHTIIMFTPCWVMMQISRFTEMLSHIFRTLDIICLCTWLSLNCWTLFSILRIPASENTR